MKIAIDAGHGGNDPGAVGPGGEHEADVNWAVAVAAAAVLEAEGGTAVFTRASQNATVSLAERVQVANDAEVDAVVSIHCNSAEVCPTRDEARVYYYRGSERGRELALRVIASFQERGLPVAPDPRGRGFYVLRYTRAPAVLVELGFICSVEGAERLMSGRGQVDGAKALDRVNRSRPGDPSRGGSCSQKVGPGLPLQTSQVD